MVYCCRSCATACVARCLGCGQQFANVRPPSPVLVKVGSPLISKRVQKFISEPATTLTAPISVICSPLGGWHDPGRGFTTRLGCSTRVLAAAVDRAAGRKYAQALETQRIRSRARFLFVPTYREPFARVTGPAASMVRSHLRSAVL